jgi:hypothetical protein
MLTNQNWQLMEGDWQLIKVILYKGYLYTWEDVPLCSSKISFQKLYSESKPKLQNLFTHLNMQI